MLPTARGPSPGFSGETDLRSPCTRDDGTPGTTHSEWRPQLRMATTHPAAHPGPHTTGAADLPAQVGRPDDGRGRTLDRGFWLAMALAAVVLLPRSALIARAHSESFDDP